MDTSTSRSRRAGTIEPFLTRFHLSSEDDKDKGGPKKRVETAGHFLMCPNLFCAIKAVTMIMHKDNRKVRLHAHAQKSRPSQCVPCSKHLCIICCLVLACLSLSSGQEVQEEEWSGKLAPSNVSTQSLNGGSSKGPSWDQQVAANDDDATFTPDTSHSGKFMAGDLPLSNESRVFILRIFSRYNGGADMQTESFIAFLKNIGLEALVKNESLSGDTKGSFNISKSELFHPKTIFHVESNSSHHRNESSISKEEETASTMPSELQNRVKKSVPGPGGLKDTFGECLTVEGISRIFRLDKDRKLTVPDFMRICPALLDQLDGGYCSPKSSSTQKYNSEKHKRHEHHQGTEDTVDHHHDHGHDGHDHSHDGHEHDHHHDHGHDGHNHSHDGHDHNHDHDNEHSPSNGTESSWNYKPKAAHAWGYTMLSVTVISLCSLAGALVIPSRRRVFYNHTLQFMVALAVGSMLSDAMLHLIPHAMMDHGHGGDDHKGHGHGGDDHEGHGHGEDSPDGHGHHDSHSKHQEAMYKGLVGLLGIYGFFFLERLFTLFTSSQRDRKSKKSQRKACLERKVCDASVSIPMVARGPNGKLNEPSCEDTVMVVHPNKALKGFADASHESYLHMCDESHLASPVDEVGVSPETTDVLAAEHAIRKNGKVLEKVDEEILGISFKLESHDMETGHEHNHGHSHSHMVNGPLPAIALMVIMGDMVHNFCDGLAIGAAFSASLAGGVSTSVAVLCHELPHEIGDFAVLIRSGLSVKRAAFLNMVSGIPCYLGAVVALLAGEYGYLSQWIFSWVGGMFIYITLADLIPEMSSVYTKCGEPWYLHLLLQACGIALGTTILLILGAAEEEMLQAFQH
ncbi:zinc transporter ZIP10-like [Aplysia californica]|uniref:Zinc transporter ZIP10-like n=1 Tax=Aplysia californica TaxID=6500 RepID=A0ABM0K2Y8_APLCA|nr:zinc transporter ZIP10-like [Aplysia californica]